MKKYVAALLILLGVTSIAVGADAHPAATAADWQVNPQGAFAAIMAQLQHLLDVHAQYKAAISVVGWVLTGIGTLVAIARLFPGPAGVVANLAWTLLAPKFLKDQDAKMAVLASGFHSVAEIMKALPKDCALGDVVCKLQAELPESVKQAYKEWERQTDIERPPTVAEQIVTAKIQATAAIIAAKEIESSERPSDASVPSQPAITPKV